jgi:SAM-dependent methyltransferase
METAIMATDYSQNIARFTGFADLYDRHRSGPPGVLAELLAGFSGRPRPETVIDLGSGTGLSTRYWADRCGRVIGIEPTPDMRRQAEAATSAPNVSYQAGFSHSTGLPAQCAQVVCCVQALHWMDPAGTFAEAGRILAPGGVFATCDYDWPPATGAWQADAAFEASIRAGRRLEQERKLTTGLQHWDKSGHLARLQGSSVFRYVRELVVHHTDLGNAERLVGLLLSQGYVRALLKAGVTEEDLGIPALRAIAGNNLGEVSRPWIWSARVRVGLV